MMTTRRSLLRSSRAGRAPVLLLLAPLGLVVMGTTVLNGACASTTAAPATDAGSVADAGEDTGVFIDFDAGDGGLPDATGDAPSEDADFFDAYGEDAPKLDADSCEILACPGTCVLGRCILQLTNAGAYDVTVRSSTVYWTNKGITPGSGSVVSIPTSPSGTAGAHALAVGQNDPLGIAVSATNVYWATGSTTAGQILSLPLGGLPDAGASDGGSMDGGAATGPIVIASGQASPTAIVVDATNVYWTTAGGAATANGTVMMAPLAGGAATTLASGRNGPAGLAVDGTSVYWIDGGLGVFGGLVLKVPIAGGTVTTIAPAQNSPSSIAITATDVYWTQLGAGTHDSAVVKAPIGGGSITTIAGNQGAIAGLAADTQNIYWAVGGGNGTGVIYRAPIGGNVVTAIVTNLDSPLDLALDDTSLYWTDNTDGTVTKATPK